MRALAGFALFAALGALCVALVLVMGFHVLALTEAHHAAYGPPAPVSYMEDAP